MTDPTQSNTISHLINMLFDFGLAQGLPKIAQSLIVAAMFAQKNQHLHANDYQRTPERRGCANGFKIKAFHSSMGRLDLHIPQVRDCQELSIRLFSKEAPGSIRHTRHNRRNVSSRH